MADKYYVYSYSRYNGPDFMEFDTKEQVLGFVSPELANNPDVLIKIIYGKKVSLVKKEVVTQWDLDE